MTDEAINVAIAEACGWKPNPTKGWMSADKTESYLCIAPDGNIDWCPSYTTDLNAMHSIEETLNKRERDAIADWLDDGNGGHFATARQRALAFIRTLGLEK